MLRKQWKQWLGSLVLLGCVALPSAAPAVTNQELVEYSISALPAAYQLCSRRQAEDGQQQILTAVTVAQEEIQAAMGSIAVSEVESCADAIQIDFENFLNYSRVTQEDFARDYLHCLTHAVR